MATPTEEILLNNMESLKEWAFMGISHKEMANMLGVSLTAFRDAKRLNPTLSALFKKVSDEKKKEREKMIGEVEKSLYKRCLGYNASVKKIQKVKKPMRNEAGEILFAGGKMMTEEVLEEVTEEQHVPADVGAIKFLLMNKAKKDWKSDPEKLANDKKRVANDTKRTKLAEENANSQSADGKCIEDYLDATEEGIGNA